MMTKKHFEAIALALGPRELADIFRTRDQAIAFAAGHRLARVTIASDLADMFKRENPNFDRERFMKACGFGKEN